MDMLDDDTDHLLIFLLSPHPDSESQEINNLDDRSETDPAWDSQLGARSPLVQLQTKRSLTPIGRSQSGTHIVVTAGVGLDGAEVSVVSLPQTVLQRNHRHVTDTLVPVRRRLS